MEIEILFATVVLLLLSLLFFNPKDEVIVEKEHTSNWEYLPKRRQAEIYNYYRYGFVPVGVKPVTDEEFVSYMFRWEAQDRARELLRLRLQELEKDKHC